MKRFFIKLCAVLFAALMAFSFAACGAPATNGNEGGTQGGGQGGEQTSPEELIIPEGYARLFLESTTGVKVDGVGVQFDPHYFSQNVPRAKPGLDEDGWELICDRIKKIGVDKFRVMVMPEWLEPENDNSDPNTIDWNNLTEDSVEMQSLYRLLDFAQQNNVDVTFVLWGCSKSTQLAANDYQRKSHFLAENNGASNWVVGAKGDMMYEYVENLSAYIQLLVGKKGYTCIKEITPGNEPDWSWQIDTNTGNAASYIAMCKELDARFKRDGIRDKVKFNLIDGASAWAEQCTELFEADAADMFNTHTYAFGYTATNSSIVSWIKKQSALAKRYGIDYFVGEFGSNQTEGSTRQRDIDSYERGVFIVRLMLNFFNGGATGMSYWTLFDYYYNKNAAYNEFMQLGLWRSVKAEYSTESYYEDLTDFQVRDQYYAYALIGKYVERGADVYPLDTGHALCAGTAFEKDGKRVYAFSNQEEEAFKFAIGDVAGEYDLLIYREGALPQGDALITPSDTVKATNRCIAFEVPAHAAVLLVQK